MSVEVTSYGRLEDMVTSPERRASLVQAGQWTQETLVGIFDEHVARQPEKTAVVDLQGRRRKSYAELSVDSRRFAAHLVERGVQAGDVVAVQMPNWYETVVVDLAVLRVGAVLNPLIPMYGVHDLQHMLEIGHTSVVVSPSRYRSHDLGQRISECAHTLGRPLEHIVLGDPGDAPETFQDFGRREFEATGVVRADHVSELLFTSGTESRPKGILHSEQTTEYAMRAGGAHLGLGSEIVVFTPSPIGHSTGLNYGVRQALHFGGTLVLQDRWEPELAVELCQQTGANCTSAAPTFLNDMLAVLVRMDTALPAFTHFTVAGAPIPRSVVKEAARRGISVLRGYGSTETLAVAKTLSSDPEQIRLETEGGLLPGVEVEIRAAQDGEDRGELFVRSPACALGYARDVARTEATFDDGWVCTGDVAERDARGHLKIVGRTKEIIIRGGMNIAPSEVEQALLTHPRVMDAVVVGLPDPRLGEIVCGCLVLDEGAQLTFEDVVDHLRSAGLATYKLPERVEFVREFPRTGTGKVRRKDIAVLFTSAGNEESD